MNTLRGFIERLPGWVIFICRLILGCVFLYASLDKLAHPESFAQIIDHYHILPYNLLHGAALLLPVVEFVIGGALILGVGIRGSALLAAMMNLVFILALSSALARNLDISCGCFSSGPGSQRIGWKKMAENGGLILLAGYAVVLALRERRDRALL